MQWDNIFAQLQQIWKHCPRNAKQQEKRNRTVNSMFSIYVYCIYIIHTGTAFSLRLLCGTRTGQQNNQQAGITSASEHQRNNNNNPVFSLSWMKSEGQKQYWCALKAKCTLDKNHSHVPIFFSFEAISKPFVKCARSPSQISIRIFVWTLLYTHWVKIKTKQGINGDKRLNSVGPFSRAKTIINIDQPQPVSKGKLHCLLFCWERKTEWDPFHLRWTYICNWIWCVCFSVSITKHRFRGGRILTEKEEEDFAFGLQCSSVKIYTESRRIVVVIGSIVDDRHPRIADWAALRKWSSWIALAKVIKLWLKTYCRLRLTSQVNRLRTKATQR